MVSFQSISGITAGAMTGVASGACLYQAGKTVAKAIKGDGEVSTFQRGLNKLLGPAGSETSKVARQALEVGAFTVTGLLLANVSASLMDPEQSVVPHFSMLGVDRSSVDVSQLMASPDKGYLETAGDYASGALNAVLNNPVKSTVTTAATVGIGVAVKTGKAGQLITAARGWLPAAGGGAGGKVWYNPFTWRNTGP